MGERFWATKSRSPNVFLLTFEREERVFLSMRELLDKIAKVRVLVIGDVMLDHYIWGDVERISPEAPVPVVRIDRDTYTAGAGANVALNIASLGGKAEVIGPLGEDSSADMLLKLLKDKGVSMDKRCRIGGFSTILKTRVVVRKQQLCRLDREDRPSEYAKCVTDLRELIEGKMGCCDAVILSDYAKGFLTEDLVDFVIKVGKQKGVFVAMDPKPKRKLVVRGLNLLTPNRLESLQMAGIAHEDHDSFPAEEVCKKIFEQYGARHLVITLGGEGMLLSEEGRPYKQIPTYAREVFDVSGAGDTAIAGLVLGLAVGESIESAAHFANTAAGVVVGKVGTATATPEEILKYHE